MISLKEVCEATGVTRKKLIGYDRLGLVCPQKRTEGNRDWLYTQSDVEKIKLILILFEAGYKRSEIKEILESDYEEMLQRFDEVANRLRKQRDTLDAWITFFDITNEIVHLPLYVMMPIVNKNISPTVVGIDLSFKGFLQPVKELSKVSGDEINEYKIIYNIAFRVLAVACLADTPNAKKQLFLLIYEASDYYNKLQEHRSLSIETASEVSNNLFLKIKEWPDAFEYINSLLNEDVTNFITETFSWFKDIISKKTLNYSED